MTMRPNMGRYIFDIIGDSIFLHDAQFRILFANRVYCREAGKPETLVLGQLYWEIFLPGSGSLPGCRVVAGEQNAKGSADEVHVGDRIFSPGATQHADAEQADYSVHILSDLTAIRQGQLNLVAQLEVLRRGYDAMLGREMRIIELKKRLTNCCCRRVYPCATPVPSRRIFRRRRYDRASAHAACPTATVQVASRNSGAR
jgi:PAS domain-containing protein